MLRGFGRTALRRTASTAGEIASCDPVRLQARFRTAAMSTRLARPPQCRSLEPRRIRPKLAGQPRCS